VPETGIDLSRISLRRFGVAAIIALLAACSTEHRLPALPPSNPRVVVAPRPMLAMDITKFSELRGWRNSDPRRALDAFRRSCTAILNKAADSSLGGVGYAGTVSEWAHACTQALDLGIVTIDAARKYFEDVFVPVRLSQSGGTGLFTGYYEPELRGSRTRHGPYQTPLYGVPSDLVSINGAVLRDTAAADSFAGRMMMSVMMMRYLPYPARAEIEREGIPAIPLFYVDDAIDAFFLQIQGSGRVALDDGTVVRAAYAGQNGQPYTAIGAVLLERGELTSEEISLQAIRAWLAAHPDQAREVMNANESYIFFSEQPIGDPGEGAAGAEGVPLTAGASLAVDLSYHALGVPIWLEATAPDPDPQKPDRIFDRLLVAQDTGGAIIGALRGDVYWGIGADAGAIAGRMKNQGRMTVLLPQAVAAHIGQHRDIPLS
jgi:membrane-bound lytic murein transglycosylase A